MATENRMWEPWCGDSYGKRRLLILGESCYLLENKDGSFSEPTIDHPKRYVELAISDADFRYRFYTTIARSLAGKEILSDGDWRSAWAEVAHTNFVPTCVKGRGRARPTSLQWDQGRFQWAKLLESLRPANVVVLGLTMWERMPPTAFRHDRFNHDYALADGSQVKCRAVRHPSAGLSWSALGQAIAELEAR